MAADELLRAERERLEEISRWYSSRDWGFYTRLVHYTYRSIAPYLRGPLGLELGPSDGEMTRFLANDFEELHVVDAAPEYVAKAEASAPNVRGHTALFEQFETDLRFDSIVVAHVLEHLVDPVAVLRRARDWLADGGRIVAVVPNAESLHRRLGVKMGLLGAVTDLNEQDVAIGHRRVYTPAALEADVEAAGLSIADRGGVFLKLLSNQQMSSLDADVVEGLYELGKDFPSSCSEVYVVAEKPSS